MTLILTELSPLGIAMAADTAVTFRVDGSSFAVPNQAVKLQSIHHLNAGISCWGIGSIGGKNTDQWLNEFIQTKASIISLAEFANELAKVLNDVVPKNTSGENRLGFHLAGFELLNNEPTPTFYHIHDGQSTTLSSRGIEVDPLKFNANHDSPPDIVAKAFAEGMYLITRNGDYTLYARIFNFLNDFFLKLHNEGIFIPYSQNLSDRADYLIFQIRMISEIYKLSNLVPGIGGGINYLTISRDGIYSQGIKYF